MPKYIDVDSSAYDYGTLADWLISSVGPEPPVWTEPHIEELLEDFYVVPKSTPLSDVEEVRHGCWIIASKLHPLPWDTDPLDWDRYEKRTHSEWEDYYECSECHKEEYDMKPRWHFCPNCGAKMDGGQDE